MKPAFPLLLAGLLAAAPLAAQQQRTDAAGPRGGELLLPTPADPQTFNPIEAADNTSQLVAGLTMADLMHTNPHTLAVEPALALRVEHRTPRLWIAHLRRGLLFSDGAPFTAADVVFSFQVWTDPRLQTAQFDLLRYNGAPVVARALDDHTVEFDLPGPAAVGDRLFDSVWILPRHRLQAAYAAGKLDQAWGAASAPGDIAGLGPFTIASFSPGQELRLARNPHYWRTAADGQPLPLLAGVRLRLIPDPNLQVRLLLAGQLDALPEVRSQDLPALEKQPCCRVLDGGPGLDVLALALNYSAAAPAGPRAWFAQTAVRRSISAAVDRANLARNVFHGAATPIATFSTPALGAFADRVPVAPADAAAALALLRPAGFTARRGQLYDADGRAVTFSLIVQAAHPEAEHLDYHRTFERYVAAKQLLFKRTAHNRRGLGVGIANADDPNGERFALTTPHPVLYGLKQGDVRAENVKLTPMGSDFTAVAGDERYHIHCNIPGGFYVSNALAAVCVGRAVGLTKSQIEQGIAALKGVEGRMTTIDEGQDFSVIVDYAHTPDSFEKLLSDMRPVVKGKLIVMFGSAGRRDEAKRAVQGELAGTYADEVVVTEEDDRDIDGQEIMNQIAGGAAKAGKKRDKNLFLVHDRTEAINFATKRARKGDTVLLLGKGHEKTIESADGEHPWDEIATAQAAAKAAQR